MHSKLRIHPARTAPGRARAESARFLRAGLLATATAALSCTSILGEFGEEVIKPSADTASASATSTGAGGSGQGGQGGQGGAGGEGGATGAGGEGGEGGAGGAGGAGGGQGGGGGGGSTICPSGQGTSMALIPGDGGVEPYCMDSTEVTIAHYFQWLETVPDPSMQGSVCKMWNTTYEPNTSGTCQGENLDPNLAPDFPIVCVDWCDAFAYCESVGKRLCGQIGGGPNPFGSPADPSSSQWYRACSAGGTKTYPYGDQYNGEACVGDGYDKQPAFQLGSDVAQEVGTAQSCQGGYPGIFDLSGNVREWEDSCETTDGPNDKCYRRGGSFRDNAAAQMCASQFTSVRGTTAPDLGFRCCAETVK